MNSKDKTIWIKENNPFKKITGELNSVKVIKHESTTSSNAFCVTNKNKDKFKFSYYNDVKTAIRVDTNVKKYSHLFPKYYGRFESIVLFDWVEGTVLTNLLTLENISKLGVLYGEIHKLNDTINSSSSKKKANRGLSNFQKICKENSNYINSTNYAKIQGEFIELIKHLDQDIILEMNNANPANIMVDEKDQLVIVSEEALNHNIKGAGIIGYLSIFSKKEKKSFWDGYSQKHPADYFTQDYEKALRMLNVIKLFVHQFNKYGKDHDKTKSAHEGLLKLMNKI